MMIILITQSMLRIFILFFCCKTGIPEKNLNLYSIPFDGPNPWYVIQRLALTVNHDREIYVQRCIAIIIYIHNS